ncbi:hypothetical protein Hdeb2414_s0003g00103241 [Helianthus debilis subsp. tardiflorus]
MARDSNAAVCGGAAAAVEPFLRRFSRQTRDDGELLSMVMKICCY